MFADQGGHVAPGEDRRLAGGALRPAGQAQGGIGRDQRRSWRDNRPALGQEPVRAQQAGQVGQSRRGERVGRRVRPTQTDAVQEEDVDKGSFCRCHALEHG